MNDFAQDFEYYKSQQQVRDYDRKRFARNSGYVVHRTQLYYIKSLIKSKRSTNVLDVPVGTGRISRELTAERLFGSDVSIPMLCSTKDTNSRIMLVQNSAFQLPYKRESFSLVISLRFIRHLDFNQRQQVYAECSRVLTEQGLLVFDAVPKSQEYDYRGRRQYSGRIYDVLYENTEELLNELNVYFSQITIVPVLHFPTLFSRTRNLIRPQRFRPIFDRLFAYIDPKIRLSTSSREWFVICEK